MKELFHYLWRGAMGGALVQFALSIVFFAASLNAGLALLLFIPASIGGVIGAILWLLSRTTFHCNLLVRMAIGSAFATSVIAALMLRIQASAPYGRPTSELLIASVFIGLEIGIPAGSLARKREDIQQLGLLSSFPLRKQKESSVR